MAMYGGNDVVFTLFMSSLTSLEQFQAEIASLQSDSRLVLSVVSSLWIKMLKEWLLVPVIRAVIQKVIYYTTHKGIRVMNVMKVNWIK